MSKVMKAKDLMIGDWVLMDFNYNEEDPNYAMAAYRPYQIQDGDDIDLACESNCLGDADVYLPIPLTLEILEKNRFKKVRDGYDIGVPLLYWDKYTKSICGINLHGNITEVCDCQYVHQLQHSLRLCRIDKEIIL